MTEDYTKAKLVKKETSLIFNSGIRYTILEVRPGSFPGIVLFTGRTKGTILDRLLLKGLDLEKLG